MADPSAPDEKGVAEPVEVPQNIAVDGLLTGQRHHGALGATADSAADMEFGVEAAAAGKNEGSERREPVVHAVDLPLKLLIWDDDGATNITYTAPATLAARYGIPPELARNLAGIDALADALSEP